MDAKKIIWEVSSLEDLMEFPADARRRVGYELSHIQNGKEPSDWKPMASIGSGVKEIRIHVDGQYRVIYLAKFQEGVYVLHAFQKKTQKTPAKDIELAKKRYTNVLKDRSKK